MSNQYSSTWFDLFLARDNDLKTRKEIQFILKHVRIGLDVKVLDIACGNGRHARKLAAYGFEIFGIDINERMLKEAKQMVPEGNFFLLDMKDLSSLLENEFDVVLILWQSFGYFDDETNLEILREIYNKLKVGGKFILDIYNREFFENHQGTRTLKTSMQKIKETKFVKNNRLEVHLDYQGEMGEDTFNWRIYSADEFTPMVEEIGFTTKVVCSNFDIETSPSKNSPRIQYIFVKE